MTIQEKTEILTKLEKILDLSFEPQKDPTKTLKKIFLIAEKMNTEIHENSQTFRRIPPNGGSCQTV